MKMHEELREFCAFLEAFQELLEVFWSWNMADKYM